MKLNKQWIRFANRRDWLATKHSKLCKFYFEEKYLWRSEECKVVKDSVLTVYPLKCLSKPSLLPTQPTTRSLPPKKSFSDEL